ncbi:hypothetical protein R3P38DRAFT_2872275 [Favolaschia claudopus]|uniref:F-box domain-containing protein n=1 Tax=Favolaschia claudopus TaxID=2862362 RepID=A0AAW0DC00_9AGAR
MSESQTLSVAQLQAHIDDLSSAIEAQKQILRGLEEQQSQARRRLNSVLDPIAHLPLELQSEIFMHCTFATPTASARSEAPVLFLHICHLWRDVALSTPRLWTGLRIHLNSSAPLDDEPLRILDTWVQRAHKLPFSLWLQGYSTLNHGDLGTITSRFQQRLRELTVELCAPLSDESTFDWLVHERLISLEALTLTSDSKLSYTPKQWARLLEATPALTSLSLENLTWHWRTTLLDTPFRHTSLRELYLGNIQKYILYSDFYDSSAAFLSCITLPALTTLRLTEFCISQEDFISFFQRSSPPLTSLTMVAPEPDSLPQGILPYFVPIESLENLEYVVGFLHSRDSLVDLLFVLSIAPILPNLRTLTVLMVPGTRPDYAELMAVLKYRRRSRPPLVSFQLVFADSFRSSEFEEDGPDEEAVLGLRKLAEEGMDIHVGFRGKNLI